MTKTTNKTIILTALVLAAVILLVSCVILPRFHKKASRAGAAYPVNLGEKNERVLCIDDNKDALIWRLRLIEQAKEEIIFSTYSFNDDRSGRDIMAALLNAAERGVHVRIVADGVTSLANLQKSDNFRALSGADNVEVRVYNPINFLKPWRLNYRMHDKYLIADNTVFILGGRNTKNLSLGDYQTKKDVDRDMLVYSHAPCGENSLSQLKCYFERVWQLQSTKPFPKAESNEAALENLREHYEQLHETYPQAYEAADWEEGTIPTNGVRFLSNPIEPENKKPELWSSIFSLMSEGQESVVQTPYLICNKQMYSDLRNLCQTGKRTDIILNAVENGANVFGCTDYINQRRKVQSTGADIYEYSKEHSSHAKTVLIDDNLSIVGSFNFDIRSSYLNTEVVLVIDCPELNAHLRAQTQAQKDASLHIQPDGTVTEGEEYVHHDMKLSQKLIYSLLRIIILPIRHLV